MEPHRESTDGSNTSPASTCWAATARFFCLFSSGSDSVLYSKFLCYVSGSPSRIAQCSASPCTSPALLPWRRPVEANHLVTLGCSLCGGLFIAHSSWSLERGKRAKLWNEDKFIILRRRMISMLPCSRTNIRARRSTSARSEQPHTPHKSCPTPIICSILSQ